MERNTQHADFWELADDLIAEGHVEVGTMMGHHCLRSTHGGGFVATVARASGNLVVKLPAPRVAELIDSGKGLAFAPAGKVFSEWVEVRQSRRQEWEDLVRESIAFVSR